MTVFSHVHQGDVGQVKVTSDEDIVTTSFDCIIIHGAECRSQDFVLEKLGRGELCSPVLYLMIMPSESPPAMAGLKCASLIGCATSRDRDHCLKHGVPSNRIVRVVHGIDMKGVKGRPGFRKRQRMNGRLFVSAGGFGLHKRMLELAQAFEKARHNDDRLVLFGYQEPPVPGYLDKCREIDGVDVILGGPRDDVLSAIAEADLYVLNSEWEGYGLVLLEAMLNGTEWAAFEGAGAAKDSAEIKFTFRLFISDRLCRRSKLIILVETKKNFFK